jgi:hypothetical protein
MRTTTTLGALLAVTLLGCGNPQTRPAEPASSARPSASSNMLSGIPIGEIAGTYTGDWGTMHLVFVTPTEVRGAYSHESGRLVGVVDGDVIRGTWCQDQAAAGRSTTGAVEFRFTKNADIVSLDGRWTYADAPSEWMEDWDINHTAAEDAALAERAPTATCP